MMQVQFVFITQFTQLQQLRQMKIFLVFQEIPQGYCLFQSGHPNDTSGNLSR